MKMSIGVDDDYPVRTLEDCSAQLRFLSTALGTHDTNILFDEEDYYGLSSMIRMIADAVCAASSIIDDRLAPLDQAAARAATTAAAPPLAPTLTEPKRRTGSKAAAAA